MGLFNEALRDVKGNMLPAFVWTILIPAVAVGAVTGGIFAYSAIAGDALAVTSEASVPTVPKAIQVATVVKNLGCIVAECADYTNSKSYLLTALAPTFLLTNATGEAEFKPKTMGRLQWEQFSEAITAGGRITAEQVASSAIEVDDTTLAVTVRNGGVSAIFTLSAEAEPVLLTAVIHEDVGR